MIDVSGIYALEDEISVKRAAGEQVALVATSSQALMNMRTMVGPEYVFTTVEDALASVNK